MAPVAAARSVWDVLDQSWWVGIGLVIALLACAWVLYHLRAWFGEDEDHTAGHQELLTHLRQLRGEGDVSEEEFRSIKRRLVEQMERSPVPSGEGPTTGPTATPLRDGSTAASGD